MSTQSLITELDARVAAQHLLKHPFYQEWTAGELKIEKLRDYATQYYRHVEAFPRYLSALHSRCDDLPTRQALLENLIEEERGERNHPELWLRFAEAVGVSREQVKQATPRPATRNLVSTFDCLSREAPLAAGLAALYVYESQIPAVAEAKIAGLRRFYGIPDGDGLGFFIVHREADACHASTGARLIEQLAVDAESKAAVIKAAERSLGALWEMLDGVQNN